MKITPDQILTSHRLEAKPKRSRSWKMKSNETPPTPPSIIIRILNRDIRNELYNKRKSFRQVDLKNFLIKDTNHIYTNHIYTNENLTYNGKNYFNLQWKKMAKQRVKDIRYQFIKTTNGNIYVKKSTETNPILIKNQQDLSLIC